MTGTTNMYPSDSQLLQNVQDLVIANHILYDQNVVDGFLNDLKRYDIRQVSGRMTDMLVSDADLGQHLACTLGEADVALMRGHGSVVVGRSLKEAVYRAVYTEINARLQASALSLGG